MELLKVIILILSGLLLTMVGSVRMINPIKNYLKNSGITLANDIDLLNEVRGMSAVMLCSGILVFLGIIFSSFRFTSFTIGALIFIGFAMGRIFSISIDGKPNSKINQGIIFELVLGGANVFVLLSEVLL